MQNKNDEYGNYYVIEWTIENFSYWNKEIHGNVITSPESCVFDGLILELYPRGLNSDDDYLVMHVRNSEEWILQGVLSFISPDGTLLCKQDSENGVKCVKFPEGPKFKEVVTHIKRKKDKNILILRFRKKFYSYRKECMRSKIEVSEISVKLQKCSEIQILQSNNLLPPSLSTETTKSLISSSQDPKSDSVTVLANDFRCLYQDQDFSDVTLRCENISIPVHKNILSARSPVFKTMLSCDMREAASNEVVITDLDPSTLVRFLTFLYTGNVEDFREESALKLYYAADKYQVPSLKKECTDFLIDNISVSNVCDMLSLADRHQDDHLIGVVRDFILNNYNDVLGSEEWKNFMRSESLLALETVTYFAEKKFVTKSHKN